MPPKREVQVRFLAARPRQTMYEKVLADLKSQFPGRFTLNIDEVAAALHKSKQALASMVHRGTFPLPVLKVGNRVAVSIYHMAEFLATGNVSPPQPAAIKASAATKIIEEAKQRRRKRGQYDWMVSFRTALDFQEGVYSALEKLRILEELSASESSNEE